jgi:hypothetical protein
MMTTTTTSMIDCRAISSQMLKSWMANKDPIENCPLIGNHPPTPRCHPPPPMMGRVTPRWGQTH